MDYKTCISFKKSCLSKSFWGTTDQILNFSNAIYVCPSCVNDQIVYKNIDFLIKIIQCIAILIQILQNNLNFFSIKNVQF